MLKCSGIGALLNLMATSTKVAREESVAAIANACSYFPPNLEFVGEKGRRMLTEVCQDLPNPNPQPSTLNPQPPVPNQVPAPPHLPTLNS